MEEFEVNDKGVFQFVNVKGFDNVYEDRLVISKEAFVEAYNKYIQGTDNKAAIKAVEKIGAIKHIVDNASDIIGRIYAADIPEGYVDIVDMIREVLYSDDTVEEAENE